MKKQTHFFPKVILRHYYKKTECFSIFCLSEAVSIYSYDLTLIFQPSCKHAYRGVGKWLSFKEDSLYFQLKQIK